MRITQLQSVASKQVLKVDLFKASNAHNTVLVREHVSRFQKIAYTSNLRSHEVQHEG